MAKPKAPSSAKRSIKLPPIVAERLEALHKRIEDEQREVTEGGAYYGVLTKGMLVHMALDALSRELDAKKRKTPR